MCVCETLETIMGSNDYLFRHSAHIITHYVVCFCLPNCFLQYILELNLSQQFNVMGLSNEFCVYTVLFLVMWTFNHLFTEMCDLNNVTTYLTVQ